MSTYTQELLDSIESGLATRREKVSEIDVLLADLTSERIRIADADQESASNAGDQIYALLRRCSDALAYLKSVLNIQIDLDVEHKRALITEVTGDES